jgi:hypothetical protein
MRHWSQCLVLNTMIPVPSTAISMRPTTRKGSSARFLTSCRTMRVGIAPSSSGDACRRKYSTVSGCATFVACVPAMAFMLSSIAGASVAYFSQRHGENRA